MPSIFEGDDLTQGKIIKSAQPFDLSEKTVSGEPESFKDGLFNETKEVIAGYFQIVAERYGKRQLP